MRIGASGAALVALALTAVAVSAQENREDVGLLRIGGAAENGDPARFDATIAEWRAAGRFSLPALERQGVLHAAARGATAAHTEIVKRLLGLGLDPNATTSIPRFPLHLAAWAGNLGTVDVLLEHDARIGVTDDDGQSVLHAAVEGGHPDTRAIATRLLALRADVRARNIWGQTPLHWAASHDASTIPILLDAGAQLEATDRAGRTPLMVAHGDGIAALLAAGANAAATDADGNTAVHWAATKGAAAVRTLVDAGVPVDTANAAGLTPLHFAVQEGGGTALAAIDVLLAHRANPNAVTTADYAYLALWLNPRANQPQLVPAGSTPLSIARARHEETKWSNGGYPPIVAALERGGATGAASGISGLLGLPISAAGVAIFAIGVLYADARMTGWARLGARYAAPAAFVGAPAARQDADVGMVGLVRVRGLMRAAALDQGLYLAMPAMARPGHAPLLVPWAHMRVDASKSHLGRAVVKLAVGTPALGTITLRGGIAGEVSRRLSGPGLA